MSSVGVIGLGRMGRPMAERLVAAGFDVVVHNRSREPVDALVALGARGAASASEVRADVVITLLPDPGTVEALTLEAARPGALRFQASRSRSPGSSEGCGRDGIEDTVPVSDGSWLRTPRSSAWSSGPGSSPSSSRSTVLADW